MSTLVLELKVGETMVINGASIRFRTKTSLELTSRARFLFGKQILSAADATTPARRIYVALQTAYIGGDTERDAALAHAEELISAFRDDASPAVCATLDEALEAARGDRCYLALRLARQVIRDEEQMPVVPAGHIEGRRAPGPCVI